MCLISNGVIDNTISIMAHGKSVEEEISNPLVWAYTFELVD